MSQIEKELSLLISQNVNDFSRSTWTQFTPEGVSLESWLTANKLESLLPTLRDNAITEISDLEELETASDVDELVNELGLKVIQRKKFKRSLLDLIRSKPNPAQTDEYKQPGNGMRSIQSTVPKKNKKAKKKKKTKPPIRRITRMKFKPGINVVPSIKNEYKVPNLNQSDLPSNGGNGFVNQMISVWTMARQAVWNKRDIKVMKHDVIVKKRAITHPERLFADKNHKVILVCGKTGAGKSTLINSMMNYIYDVEMGDNFRLKLIEEPKKPGGDAESCTDHISSYRIKKPRGGNIDYDLTIIDTPGFGDTHSLDKDRQTLEAFKYVFNKILTSINGICFVLKSTDNRLDASQTYVFNNILNLWAKDVADNIFILMTFCDGSRANCIDALNKNDVLKRCHRRLKINNSAFTDDPMDKDSDDSGEFEELFWNMGMKCFEKFFKSLREVKPKAIENSKQVLRQRDGIQTQIHHISMSVDNQLRQQQKINAKKRMIKQHKKDIDAGKDVYYMEEEEEWVKEPASNHLITTCVKHQSSCHPTCCVKDKNKCVMMNNDNYCKVCTCPASDHINADYEYKLRVTKVRKVNLGKQKVLKQRKSDLSASQSQLKRLEEILKKNQQLVNRKLRKIQFLRKELQKIALRPQLTTLGNYIDQLIDIEENSPERDAEKIQMLKALKKKEDIIMKLDEKGSISTHDFVSD
eukprot:313954_1